MSAVQDRFRKVNSPVNPISILTAILFCLIYVIGTWLLANSVLKLIGSALAGLIIALGFILGALRVHRMIRRRPVDRQEKIVFYFLLSYLNFNILLSLGIGQVRVQGNSMLPGLRDGQLAWMTRWHSGWQLPAHHFPLGRLNDTGHLPRLGLGNFERGDIIVFRLEDRDHPEHQDNFYVKRIVAMPGDSYAFDDGQLWINEQQVSETYLYRPRSSFSRTTTIAAQPVNPPTWYNDLAPVFVQTAMDGVPPRGRVPPGGVLVLGDNRDISQDSRSFGFIPFALIEGRLIKP